MEILSKLKDKQTFIDFIEEKEKGDFTPQKEINAYKRILNKGKVLDIAKKIADGEYSFTLPKKIVINKIGKRKKRIVYSFTREENFILKVIANLLHCYDDLFPKNLFSFRKSYNTQIAVKKIINIKKRHKVYAYKLDIHSYFNSINPEVILKDLEKYIKEEKLLKLFSMLLNNHLVFDQGKTYEEVMGIIPGMPLSSFMANLYLRDLDLYFYQNKKYYFRYADDIIILNTNLETLNQDKKFLLNFLKTKGLIVNPDKESFFDYKDPLTFLGFEIGKDYVDIAKSTYMKIKGKIKRRAKLLIRRKHYFNLTNAQVLTNMNKRFNNKFYSKDSTLCWEFYYFPLVTRPDTFKKIDEYMQENQRYIVTEKHNKANFQRVDYDFLKECGYKPLVTEYYKFKNKKVGIVQND
ncbi:MAG: group II intron reverse transcriptase domain-containing protein [Clostridia bacterium]|nr:group II intron reverse transcriptase domain-containing protein [Clostridia bacterium]